MGPEGTHNMHRTLSSSISSVLSRAGAPTVLEEIYRPKLEPKTWIADVVGECCEANGLGGKEIFHWDPGHVCHG